VTASAYLSASLPPPTLPAPSVTMKIAVIVALLMGVAAADRAVYTLSEDSVEQLLLRNFQGFRHEVNDHTGDGTYQFLYHVGDSEREEVRSESGEVSGRFAFVAPEGNEVEVKYEADEDGFRADSEALPEAPEDTDAVKAAKEEFFEAYEKAAELAGSYEYSYEDSDESGESSEESSEEYGESSEESDESSEEEEESSSNRLRFVPFPYTK